METILYVILTFGCVCLILLGFFYSVLPPHDKGCICKSGASNRWNVSLPRNANMKPLSRECKVKNVQVKPYTETRTSDFEPPKPVRPNTTSSIKDFKR